MKLEHKQRMMKNRWRNLRYRRKHGAVDELAPLWAALREWKRYFYGICKDCDPLIVRCAWRRLRKAAGLPPDLTMVEREIRLLRKSLTRRSKTLAVAKFKKWMSRKPEYPAQRLSQLIVQGPYSLWSPWLSYSRVVLTPKLSAFLDQKFR